MQRIAGEGIGKILMSAAEDRAALRGVGCVALHSKATRPDAHSFYGALRYELIAASHLFRRDLRR
ncbi:MAG TPA: GNAT family N-acetyltransferase [Stellaceae bacterium]|nr:GNAT family N-acetyltransferase [Stellaceae bacterium]